MIRKKEENYNPYLTQSLENMKILSHTQFFFTKKKNENFTPSIIIFRKKKLLPHI